MLLNNINTFSCALDLYSPCAGQSKKVNEMRNIERYNHYSNIEIEMLISMFEYEDLPQGLWDNMLETCLALYGIACVAKNGYEYYVGVPALVGDLDQYGFGTVAEMTTRNGITLNNLKVGKDCVLFWNNKTRTPDYDIFRFASMFADVDIAMKSIVRNSKKHPVPVARDSKTKVAIDEVMKSSTDGLTDTTIINNVPFDASIEGISTEIPVLNLTDPHDADRLQYLSKFHDDLLRRLATLYGHDMQTSGKMAQQTTDELQGYDSYSMIYPENRLSERLKAVEELNKVFNLNVKVDYSLAWRYNIYKQDKNDDGIDKNTIDNEEGVSGNE